MMHILWRDGLQDDDYLDRYCLGTEALRERVHQEYGPARVAEICGLEIAEIEKLTHEYAASRPALIRLNYGLQRHGGGGMAVRTIVCLPAIVGSWREVGGGALLSTSKLYPFANTSRLERPDLIPPGTRTINMVQLAEALHGELPGPPVRALFVYNSNPAAVCPDQSRVLDGLRREDLFTVVHDQFQTDTANYADIVLPATTQLEHFDIHGSYGHLYVQLNEPAIAPLGEAKCNTDVFRLLARKMGLDARLFEVSDEDLARVALEPPAPASKFPPVRGHNGITIERLRREGPVRLNVPKDYTPFAEGGFNTPSGKCEFYSARLAERGLDPLPTWTPPHEDPRIRLDLSARFPLQLLTPPETTFLNSTFVNVKALRDATSGEPIAQLHPDDAAEREITAGMSVRLFNDRGSFLARAAVGPTVRPGVVVCQGLWWAKYVVDKVNCNTTTSTALTDFGAAQRSSTTWLKSRRQQFKLLWVLLTSPKRERAVKFVNPSLELRAGMFAPKSHATESDAAPVCRRSCPP